MKVESNTRVTRFIIIIIFNRNNHLHLSQQDKHKKHEQNLSRMYKKIQRYPSVKPH